MVIWKGWLGLGWMAILMSGPVLAADAPDAPEAPVVLPSMTVNPQPSWAQQIGKAIREELLAEAPWELPSLQRAEQDESAALPSLMTNRRG